MVLNHLLRSVRQDKQLLKSDAARPDGVRDAVRDMQQLLLGQRLASLGCGIGRRGMPGMKGLDWWGKGRDAVGRV
jgi:hypothetical protein